MKKIIFGIAVTINSFCQADMICIENDTGETITIKIKQGEYTLKKCEIDCMLAKYEDLFSESLISLQNKEQFLFKSQHTFKNSNEENEPCGFYINESNIMINVVDYDFKKRESDDFTIETIINYADNPLSGKAFFSDRMYRVTKASSEHTSPKKTKSLTKRKAHSEE